MRTGGVLVLGEALADMVPEDAGGERYACILGGSGFNTALALARCGATAGLAATLSRDATGRRFLAAIEAEGIDRRFLSWSDLPSPLAMVAPIGADGGASYRFHLSDTAFACAPSVPQDLAGIGHVHLTSFGATVGGSGAAALSLLRRARAAGVMTSFDLNIRPPALPAPEDARAALADRIALSDIVKLSVEDADWAYGTDRDNRIAGWLAEGAAMVLLTDGERGAHLLRPGRPALHAHLPCGRLVDTIGAGDAFMGAFLAGLCAGGTGLREGDDEALRRVLEHACGVAALTCARPGCDPPRARLTMAEDCA